jgi:hypothetical protein
MEKHLSPELLTLYHGSLELLGSQINIRSGTGVGWNSLTLGDAFYTSLSVDAAMLFSQLVLQKSILMEKVRYENQGFAKVYEISLDKNISILDSDHSLDTSSVRGVLLRAGVSQRYLDYRHNDQLTDFYKSADLLCHGMEWEGNRNEYLCRQLGYDALMIKERAWMNCDYYPEDIGIDWGKLNDPLIWPPKTVAVYNQEMVTGFELCRDGRVYGNEIELSDYSR